MILGKNPLKFPLSFNGFQGIKMKKIAIITARSGSKGLPNKNVLFVEGKPLIAYTIEAGLASGCFERIIVSTDSQEYIDLLAHYPVEFIKRAEHLATDTTSSFAVIEDVLQQTSTDFDYFVLLQPTSPLRSAEHIQQACQQFEQHFAEFDFCVSVSEAHKPTTLTRIIEGDKSLKHWQLNYANYARQQYHPEYSPNGAIFAAKPTAYLAQKHFYGEKSLAYFMEKAVSLDIDDRDDFDYFCYVMAQRQRMTILRQQLLQKIALKRPLFNQVSPITLIGHSIIEQWQISTLNGKAVNNLGFWGIVTEEYLEMILQAGLISQLGEQVVLMLGVNDLTREDWTFDNIVANLQRLIDHLHQIRSDCAVFFLEATPSAFRPTVNNADIRQLNQMLKTKLTGIHWIELDDAFSDKYGKLNLEFSEDGLHLNALGYQKLTEIVEQALATHTK